MSQPEYRVVDPASGEVVAAYPFATEAGIEAALDAVASGHLSWSARPLAERAAVVARAGELFTERADELASIITTEMGKARSQALGEIAFCAEIFAFYATEGPALVADRELALPGGDRAVVEKRPLGPLLGIMPWNYPYYQVARFAAPNLLLGNTIVLKHAESCPQSALAIEQLLVDAGLPAEAYVNVFATHDQVATMIADPRIRAVSLTGSERAGAIVGELAGRALKKVVLELGGSDPYVVLDTDDVAAAAALAWETRMENLGQACNSNKRLIVAAPLHDEFVAALAERATGLVPGDPHAEAPGTYAPMSSRAAAEGIAAQVADAVAKGATLHAGGVLGEAPSAYFSPAVLSGVAPEMRAWHEELFGPVAVVLRADDDEDAVRIANDSAYGLGGAVFSTDRDRAVAVASRLEVGMAHVNTPAAESAAVPFGGVKRSGFGRELGAFGLDEFVNHRVFVVA